MNKKAVSLMISYVILISIALGISTGVYVWMKYYANIEPVQSCEDGTTMVLEDYTCLSGGEVSDYVFRLSLRNTGLFSIDGFILHVGNDPEKFPTVRLENVDRGAGLLGDGHNDFPEKLKPGAPSQAEFKMGDILKGEIKVIQIQPFILDSKGKKIVCEGSEIKQTINDCPLPS